MESVLTFFDLTPTSCAEETAHTDSICTPMRGVCLAATFKNAKQRTVEAHTQVINNIAMRIDVAFGVPRTNIGH